MTAEVSFLQKLSCSKRSMPFLTNWKETYCASVRHSRLPLNHIEVVSIITLVNDMFLRFHLPLKHGIKDLRQLLLQNKQEEKKKSLKIKKKNQKIHLSIIAGPRWVRLTWSGQWSATCIALFLVYVNTSSTDIKCWFPLALTSVLLINTVQFCTHRRCHYRRATLSGLRPNGLTYSLSATVHRQQALPWCKATQLHCNGCILIHVNSTYISLYVFMSRNCSMIY